MPSNNNQRLLEGEVVDNPQADEVARLRDLNRTLTRELHDALDENERLRKRVATADVPVARLREKLAPFYQLLQAVFGDIDELSPDASSSPGAAVPPKNAAVWEAWKGRLPTGAGKIIDALMKHGDANTQQLSILTGLHRNSIPRSIYELNKAGLINKNGGRFSLKVL